MGELSMSYEHDIFYGIEKLPLEERVAVMDEAYAVNTRWWVDELNCDISWARRKIDMPYEDVMKMYSGDCHTVVIHRRGDHRPEGRYGEIGFTTMGGVSTYLWIYVTEEDLFKIIKRHKLKPR